MPPGKQRTEYYHRYASDVLIAKGFRLLLDVEAILPGEDEIACALRLLVRLLADYPRAFDVVFGDGLYTDPRIYNFLVEHGKDVLTVLEDDRRDLVKDASPLFDHQAPEPDGEIEQTRSEWLWVTTLLSARAGSRAVVEIGHSRWDIEKYGFNEPVTCWHANHVYKHDPTAMLVLPLVCILG